MVKEPWLSDAMRSYSQVIQTKNVVCFLSNKIKAVNKICGPFRLRQHLFSCIHKIIEYTVPFTVNSLMPDGLQ